MNILRFIKIHNEKNYDSYQEIRKIESKFIEKIVTKVCNSIRLIVILYTNVATLLLFFIEAHFGSST
jgi:hypothetical protein